jgi:hypothetical protein
MITSFISYSLLLVILEGTITIGVASIAFFILPNFPRTTKWLSEEQRQLATWRLQEDIGMDDWVSSEGQSFWHGFKLAFTDIKTYVLMALLFGIVASGSVTNFFPTGKADIHRLRIDLSLTTVQSYKHWDTAKSSVCV